MVCETPALLIGSGRGPLLPVLTGYPGHRLSPKYREFKARPPGYSGALPFHLSNVDLRGVYGSNGPQHRCVQDEFVDDGLPQADPLPLFSAEPLATFLLLSSPVRVVYFGLMIE